MRRLTGIIGAAALACLLAATALWAYQARLVFEPGRRLQARPGDFAFAVVETAVPVGREALKGWWIPGKPAGKVVLYLHGNDDNVATAVREVAPLRDLGHSVLVIDYRGFGASRGRFPSEASVYEDAEAAWRYLVGAGVRPSELYIYGHSLGGAIAIELARRHPEAAGLVVESSFTSIYDMAMLQRRYAWLPVRRLLNQRFDSLAKVAGLSLPVLYLHGTADEVVPYDMGRRLYEASGGEKRFVALEGGRHEHDAAATPILLSALGSFVR